MLRQVSKSPTRHAGKATGGCFVWVFGGIFILAGLAVGTFLYFPIVIDAVRVQSWVETPCELERVEMNTSRSSKGGTSYKVVAWYHYRFQGQTYSGDRVGLSSGSDNVGDFQQRVFAELQTFEKSGRPYRCFVDPADPSAAVLNREMRWGLAVMLSLFPLLFPLVGGFVAFGGVTSSREAKGVAAAQELHPGAPWKWRPEWRGNTITPQSDGLRAWISVGVWVLLIQLPLAAAVVLSGALAASSLAALAFVPCLLAAIPLMAAWRRVKLRSVLGIPSLELREWPMKAGRESEAGLLLAKNLSPLSTLTIRVSCSKVVTRRTGKGGTSTHHESVWENAQSIPGAEAQREIIGSRVPLRIDIPRGYPGCDAMEGSGAVHEWALEVGTTAAPGRFKLPLPVFGMDEGNGSTDELPAELNAPSVITDDELATRLKGSGMVAEFGEGGTPTSIHCPPGRMRATALFLILFGLVWSAVFTALVVQNAPFLFRFIWGVTSPAILLGGVWLLIHDLHIEITGRELCVRSRAGPFYSKVQRFEARHIVRFTTDSNMQSGNQSFYRVRAETTFAKTITLVDGIRDSATAEALARKLTEWKEGE